MSNMRWLPLESNPDVMNKCIRSLGVPEHWGISDIVSFDEELMGMIPTPSLAVLLLFPVTMKYNEYCDKQEEILKNQEEDFSSVYYMKQTIRNGCGTIALLHALANNAHVLELPEDCVLKKFLDSTMHLDAEDKGKVLEQNIEIGAVHEAVANEGQTETPNVDDDINLHFIALVNVNDILYELDGRKSGPVVHGSTSKSTFLQDALRVCKEFIARDPNNLNFNAMSFGAMPPF